MLGVAHERSDARYGAGVAHRSLLLKHQLFQRLETDLCACHHDQAMRTSAAQTTIPALALRKDSSTTSDVLQVTFEARLPDGRARGCGGDTYLLMFDSGPERSMPHLTDHCNGSYTVSVQLSTPGHYSWNAVLEWDHNRGLDERKDPTGIGQRSAAIHQPLQRKWVVDLLPASQPAPRPQQPCSRTDTPARYVRLPTTGGAVASAFNQRKRSNPGLFNGLLSSQRDTTPVDKWVPFDCVRQQCTTAQLRHALSGRVIGFVGESATRQMHLHFITLALGVDVIEPCGCEAGHGACNGCLCHGMFVTRVPVVPGRAGQRIQAMCFENAASINATDLPAPPLNDEIVVTFQWLTGVACEDGKGSNVTRWGISVSECKRISGDDVVQRRLMDWWLPQVHYPVVNLGMHETMRDGTRGCLNHFAKDIDWVSALTEKARMRFLLESTADVRSFSEAELLIGPPRPGQALPRGLLTTRHEYCALLQQEWARGQKGQDGGMLHWQYIERYAPSWLSPEWNENAVHYVAQPAILNIASAIYAATT